MSTFAEIIDAASSLSVDEQQALLEIIGRRLAEQNRSRIIRDTADGRAEFSQGNAVVSSVGQIMSDLIDEA
jgi:hypothetical protein